MSMHFSGDDETKLVADLRGSLKRRDFWAFSLWLDLVTKYRRSALGMVWILMPPICYVFGIGYFYSLLFGKPALPFMLHLGIGYMLWRVITQVISGSTVTMMSHRSFIMDGRTRYTDYVMREIAKAAFYFVVTMIVVLPLVLMEGPGLAGIGSVLITLPLFFLNVMWIGVVAGVLGARFPDLHEFSSTIFIFGFLLTPIVWRADLMPADSWRGFVARLNPAFHYIEFVRAPLLGEPVEFATILVVLGLTVVGWGLAFVTYQRYGRYVALWL